MKNVSSARKYTGSKSNIHTAALQVVNEDYKCEQGLQLYAPSTNSGTVYVGFSQAITADGGDSTTGFPMIAGAALLVPTRNANEIFAIGSVSGNKLFWMVV